MESTVLIGERNQRFTTSARRSSGIENDFGRHIVAWGSDFTRRKRRSLKANHSQHPHSLQTKEIQPITGRNRGIFQTNRFA